MEHKLTFPLARQKNISRSFFALRNSDGIVSLKLIFPVKQNSLKTLSHF